MTKILDGLNFDFPPTTEQVMALAHLHRKNMDEAIFHSEIRLGDYCLAQRKRVYDFTTELSVEQRKNFYKTYNGELIRIADDEETHHLTNVTSQSRIVLILIVLAIIAVGLYCVFIRGTIS